MNTFALMYPRAEKLGLPVVHAGPGFDELELEEALGKERFAAFQKMPKRSFVCGHRSYPSGEGFFTPEPDRFVPAPTHRITGYEVICYYAEDVEMFLAKEGK